MNGSKDGKGGPIDVDDPSSWPTPVTESIRAAAGAFVGSTEFFGDLDVPFEEEAQFRVLTSGYLVRGYHATRLLDHEVDAIKRVGLLRLTEELVANRIQAAVENGHLDEATGDSLLGGNALKSRALDKRANQVCLFLSKVVLRNQVSGVWPLLTIWGGEGINFTHAGKAHESDLAIGTPSIVVSLLDLGNDTTESQVHPGLKHLFVGKWLGFDEQEGSFSADVFYYSSIPSENIEEILQPGHPDYDLYTELPQH